MKLWLLKKINAKFQYDEVVSFVIAAESEMSARDIADENAGGEGDDFWTNANCTLAIMIAPESIFEEERLVIREINAG